MLNGLSNSHEKEENQKDLGREKEKEICDTKKKNNSVLMASRTILSKIVKCTVYQDHAVKAVKQNKQLSKIK